MAYETWGVDVATTGSPTVRRRRLAAELRRLRGKRTGSVVARALGWSPAKISRYELGQGGFPPDEVEKLLDYYGVPEPRRAQLLLLAADANERGWWEDFSDAIGPEYMEFVGLEAEAHSVAQWQVETIPGLLQTEQYARCILEAIQTFWPTPPSVIERRLDVRMARRLVLTEREPPLRLSAVLDESALYREIGGSVVMLSQLRYLAEVAELPNIELRVLPLRRESSLMASSFVIFGFDSEPGVDALGDVVCTETVSSGEVYVEGETDTNTYPYRKLFESLARDSLSPEASINLINRVSQNFSR